MKSLIACCGIDCEKCEARIATIKNDCELKKKVAKKWSALNNISAITAEHINCMGCRTEGVKSILWIAFVKYVNVLSSKDTILVGTVLI